MKGFERWLGLVLLAAVGLQLFFVLRVVLMVVVATRISLTGKEEAR